MTSSPRIAIPEPTSTDQEYNQRTWRQYAEAVEQAGGIAVPVPLKEAQSTLARIASSCSGVLLPGCANDVDPEKYGAQRIPECNAKDGPREAVDDLLLQDAFNLHKPILGICYGLQSLNVWRNGSLIQDLTRYFEAPGQESQASARVDHKPGRTVQHAHPVAVDPGSHLAQILNDAADVEHAPDVLRLSVNSSHHQAIQQAGDQLRIVARSPLDGVIEALESPAADQFILGVQWHPERTREASSASRAIFQAFVQAVRDWHPRPIRESVAN